MGRRSRFTGELDLNRPRKRQRLTPRSQRRLAVVLMLYCAPVAAAAVLIGLFLVRSRDSRSPAERVPLVDGEVRVPASDVGEGDARFYLSDAAAPVEVRFIVVRRLDRTLGVALDASEKSAVGFRRRDDRLACNGCSLRFPVDDVARRTGGCYPVPLRHALRDGNVVVRSEDLVAAARLFERR